MFNFLKRKQQTTNLDWRALDVEPTDSSDYGPCSCCGNLSRTVWGFVHSPDATVAAYFVQWTLNNPQHGANVDLIIGEWGEQTRAAKRQAVSMEYRVVDQQGSFMVIDASTRPVAQSELTGEALSREEVIGEPIAAIAFAVADAIFVNDERIEEIRRWR